MLNAYATYDDLRDKGSVVRIHAPDVEPSDDDAENQSQIANIFGKDAHFVVRYEEAIVALLDEHFSVDPRTTMTEEQRAQQDKRPVPDECGPFSRSLLAIDPPDHTRLRRLVQPSFSATAMEARRPRIQRIADDLLDQAARAAEERGERAPDRQMERVDAYAYPMPVTVISDMVGIPLADRPRVREWTEKLLTNRRGRRFSEQAQANLKEFVVYLRELFAEKRKHPTDDLASQLVYAKEDDDVLDEDDLLSMIFIVYLAGHVTTVNLIGNGVVSLLRNPAQRDRLVADPWLARGVVEETLRYWGPVDMISRRVATEDVSVGGTLIKKGVPHEELRQSGSFLRGFSEIPLRF
jgi:cytochrome P450